MNHDFTPFDAIHLVQSRDEPIVSGDASYDAFSERVALVPSKRDRRPKRNPLQSLPRYERMRDRGVAWYPFGLGCR